MLKWLTKVLGLSFNPATDGVRFDYAQPQRTAKPATKTQPAVAAKLVTAGGKTWEVTTGDDMHEWCEYTTPIDKRQADVTTADQLWIDCPNITPALKGDKYARIKARWALGESAAQAAEHFDARGYGVRTIEHYYAVINAASLAKKPPTEQE